MLRQGIDSALVEASIVKAKEGNRDALHFLYVRYAPEVLTCVKGMVKDSYEGIVQSVFLKLMSSIKRYEPREVPLRRLARAGRA